MTNRVSSLLKQVDLLEGVDPATLERLAQAGSVVPFEQDEYVIRQGEYGDSFFLLLNGRAKVQVIADDGTQCDIDELQPGQYFGELAMVGHGERIASVKCLTAAELLELKTATFENLLRKYKQVKARIESVFVRQSLTTFIRQSRYFRDLPVEMREQLVASSTLMHYSKGEVIANEGESAQRFFIVRSGFVRISRAVSLAEAQGDASEAATKPPPEVRWPSATENPGGGTPDRGMQEEILAYLGPEDFFGDQEVTSGSPYGTTAVAVEPVECMAVPRSVVWKVYLEHPDVFSAFRRYQVTRSQMQQGVIDSNTSMGFVRDMLEAGLGQARSALIISMDACVRCGNCVQACDDLHGFSRIARRGKKMTRRVDLESKRHESLYFPTSCLQCSSPECMVGCPTGAISRDTGGEVYIKDTCIGCGNCARNCDFGNISMAKVDKGETSIVDMVAGKAGEGGAPPRVASTDAAHQAKSDLIAVKCDVCFEREFAACVYNCPTSAILRIDPRNYFEELVRIAPKLAIVEGASAGAKTTTKRPNRWIDPVLQILVAALSVTGGYALWLRLKPSSWSGIGFHAGIAAVALIFVLALMGIRKRLRTSKLGSLATWARIHAVAGGLLYGIVLFHAGYQATSLLTAALLFALTLATMVGVGGQIASAIIPRLLSRTEDEALLPEDVVPKMRDLLEANEQYLRTLNPLSKKRVEVHARRLAESGLSMISLGLTPRQLTVLLERRAKRLPPLAEAEHAMAIRIAENLSAARLHAMRRGLEVLMISWVPVHLVASTMSMMLLMGHLMCVLLW